MMLLSRRTLLRSAAVGGVALGLPALEGMFGGTRRVRAAGSGLPKRLVLFHFGNGAPMKDWTPPALGADFTATELLQSLGSSLDEVDVVSGLSTKGTHGDMGLTGNIHGMRLLASTTCVPGAHAPGSNAVTGAGGPSVDQVLAKSIGAHTAHSSLVVAAQVRNNNVLEGRYSWSGVNSPIAPIVEPHDLYGLLFGNFTPQGPDSTAAEQVLAQKRSVLDYVSGSNEALQSKLGSADRARLDEHLTAVRELEKTLEVTSSITCSPPAAPGSVAPGPTGLDDRCEALLRLITAALSCDLTRVVSFSVSVTGGGPVYDFLGVSEGDHEISHLDYAHDAGSLEAYRTITRWKLSKFGRLIELLSSTPEGAGTLLDNCVVICFSEMSDGFAHLADFLPVLVAGSGAGHRRHLAFPCRADGLLNAQVGSGPFCTASESTHISQLWLTALRACDASISDFGLAAGKTLPELWA